jgi:hypothetical protein
MKRRKRKLPAFFIARVPGNDIVVAARRLR